VGFALFKMKTRSTVLKVWYELVSAVCDAKNDFTPQGLTLRGVDLILCHVQVT
jgi:hypothetical protein